MNYFILQSPQPNPPPSAREFQTNHALGLILLLAIPFFLFLLERSRAHKPLLSVHDWQQRPTPFGKELASSPPQPFTPLPHHSPTPHPPRPPTPTLPSSSTHPHPHPLYSQILAMIHWDRPTADRLLELARVQHPGRTDRWYHEKVIEDLIRDRR